MVARGEDVHPEVLKLRTLQAEKVLRDGPEQQVGIALADSQLPLRSQPKRREHRSQATLENTHCRYCGEVGHRIHGCEKAKSDIDLQALGLQAVPRAADLEGEDKRIAQIVAHLKYTWLSSARRRTKAGSLVIKRRRPSRATCSVA